MSGKNKPQVLLFSATVPSWVEQTADKYMSRDRVLVDLIGQQSLRTAVTVEHKAISCPYSESSSAAGNQKRTGHYCWHSWSNPGPHWTGFTQTTAPQVITSGEQLGVGSSQCLSYTYAVSSEHSSSQFGALDFYSIL